MCGELYSAILQLREICFGGMKNTGSCVRVIIIQGSTSRFFQEIFLLECERKKEEKGNVQKLCMGG